MKADGVNERAPLVLVQEPRIQNRLLVAVDESHHLDAPDAAVDPEQHSKISSCTA